MYAHCTYSGYSSFTRSFREWKVTRARWTPPRYYCRIPHGIGAHARRDQSPHGGKWGEEKKIPKIITACAYVCEGVASVRRIIVTSHTTQYRPRCVSRQQPASPPATVFTKSSVTGGGGGSVPVGRGSPRAPVGSRYSPPAGLSRPSCTRCARAALRRLLATVDSFPVRTHGVLPQRPPSPHYSRATEHVRRKNNNKT